MSNKNVIVVKDPAGWRVQYGKDTMSKHRTQENAIKRAKPIAKEMQTELIIQGRDGKIRSKDSYGNDPNPPKDREH